MTWFSLLPNARTELATIAQPPVAPSARRRVQYDVEIRADGAPAGNPARTPVGAEILGAGDVVGIDPRMIARVDPPPGATGFEPNYFPFVEFVDADFPWRFSFAAGAQPRLLPWLVLLALKANELEFLDPGSGPLPRVRIGNPAAALPDLAQSCAFAHVHVAHGAARSNDLPALVASRPELHFARLMCARKLEPNTAYSLLLVPSTEAGRLSGLGRSEQAEPFDKPAWGADSAPGLELPIYYQTRFVTSVLEDFELLVRRLQPFPIGEDSKVALPVEAFAGDPGYYPGYANPSASFEVQDALMRADRSVQAFNTDPALHAQLKPTLESVIAGETLSAANDGPDHEDPLLAMPPYGFRFRKQHTLDATAAQQGQVVDRVNLDLKFRHAAGLGAEAVRRNQELFSRICFSQYREVVAANQALARLQAARQLNAVLAAKHLAKLPSSIVLSLAEPAHALARLAGGGSAAEQIAAAGVPASYASRALRRVAAKRTLRVAQGTNRRAPATAPMPTLPGDPSLAPPRPVRVPRALRVRAFALEPVAVRQLTQLFGSDVLTAALPAPARAIAVHPVDSRPLALAVAELFAALPGRKAIATIAGLAAVEGEKLDPIMRAPVISEPLVERLRAFEKEALLRATDGLPNNTVSVVKENRAFVEAFLLGANHELNNELRFREFPTDMRGTIVRRFWNRKRAPSDPTGDDIGPIHGWTQPLGANYPPHDSDRKEALVLLVRGDLVRKYGEIIVGLHRANGTSFVQGQGVEHASIFSGLLDTDIAYYGFDVARDTVLADKARHFFVLYEVPGRVRFGLDIGTAAVRRQRFAFLTARPAFPLASLDRAQGRPLVPLHLKTGGSPPAQAARWDELSWAHMQLDGAGYIDVVASAPGVSEAPNYWSANRDAASIARSFWQKPVAAVLPATRVL